MHRVEIRDVKINKIEDEEKFSAEANTGEAPKAGQEDISKIIATDRPKSAGGRGHPGLSNIQAIVKEIGDQNKEKNKQLLSVFIRKLPSPPFNLSFSLEAQLNHLIDLYSKIM